MPYLYALTRLLAGLMILPLLLAFAFFAGGLDVLWILYGALTVAAFAAAAVFPRKYYRRRVVRGAVLALYVGAVCLAAPIMFRDLTLINYPDYPAFMIRGAGVLVLALMIVEAVGLRNREGPLNAPEPAAARRNRG